MTVTNQPSPAAPRRELPHRRLDIQGLRALAVVFVVAFHADLPLPGGFVGVDVFFVISGFVITAMLIREKVSTGRISLRKFYVRRFRRLTPALALMVTVTVVVSALPFSSLTSQGMVATTAIGTMFLFANYAVAVSTGGYFDPAADLNPLLHTWTLSFEEQFYLILPIAVIAAWYLGAKVNRARWVVAIAVSLIGIGSLALALLSARDAGVALPDSLVGFYGPLGRVWEFAAGALLAIAASRLSAPSSRVATVIGMVGVGLLAYSLLAFSGMTAFPGPATLVPVAATLMLLYVGSSPGNVVSRILSSRPLVALGDISYSWYLWHWPMIVFARFIWPEVPAVPVLAATISIVPAYLSYRFVEQRFRSPAQSTRKRLLALVAITLLVPVALGSGLTFVLSNSYWSPQVQRMQATQELHAGVSAGCMLSAGPEVPVQPDCEWNSEGTGAPIYLIGDSIADHYSEALIGASEIVDRPLFIRTAAGCPAYRVFLKEPKSPEIVDVTELEGCTPYSDGVLWRLDNTTPGLVIMGARDISWWSPTDVIDPALLTGSKAEIAAKRVRFAAEADAKEEALTSALVSTVDRLHAAGHQVAIVQSPPSYRIPAPAWLPMSCSVSSIIAENCGRSVPLAEMDVLQRRTRETIVRSAALSGATVLDLRDYFCPDDVCVTRLDGSNLYLDDIHISVEASKNLVPLFAQFIQEQN
jgi:peptidoglycan/LPS O-acetylase OafA/YrhL